MSMGPKYKRMIDRMMAKKKVKKGKRQDKWVLYILQCSNGAFYTGITNNVERRFKMHNEGKASKFTRTRRPVKLIYQEKCGTRIDALSREYKVKTFTRQRKKELIQGSI